MNMAKLARKDKQGSEKGSGPSKLVAGERKRTLGEGGGTLKCLGQETRETNESATKNDFGGEVIFLSESEKGHF